MTVTVPLHSLCQSSEGLLNLNLEGTWISGCRVHVWVLLQLERNGTQWCCRTWCWINYWISRSSLARSEGHCKIPLIIKETFLQIHHIIFELWKHSAYWYLFLLYYTEILNRYKLHQWCASTVWRGSLKKEINLHKSTEEIEGKEM